MDKKGQADFKEGEEMGALFIALGVLTFITILFFYLWVTIRVRLVFGPKEKSFVWHWRLLGKEYDLFPKTKIKKEFEERDLKSAYRLIRDLLKKTRFWQVDAYALVGTGDAASTALLCGLIDATFNAIGDSCFPKGRKGRGWLMRTTPSFSAKTLELQINGIFRIGLFDIIRTFRKWHRASD